MSVIEAPITGRPDAFADPEYETWKSTTDATIVLKVRGEYGIERELRIVGRKTFQVTPRDRRLNQERTASEKFDPFLNGSLAVVNLVDGEPDNAALEANPNVISDEEILRILKMRDVAGFMTRLDQITNHTVFQRMLELAESHDVSHARYKAVEGALAGQREIRTVQTKKFQQTNDGLIPVAS